MRLAAGPRFGVDGAFERYLRVPYSLPTPVLGLLRLLRTDLEARTAANHRKVLGTTTDVARVDGVRVNARWTREFLLRDPRADLARLTVPVLALTGDKDLQVPADDLAVLAATVPGPVEVQRVPDLTHTLRRQPRVASMRHYREELRRPVDPEVLATVVAWCRSVSGVPASS